MRAPLSALAPLLLAAASALSLCACSDRPDPVDMTGFKRPNPALAELERLKAGSREIELAQRELREAAAMGPATLDQIEARVASEAVAAQAAGEAARQSAKTEGAAQFHAFQSEASSALSEQREALDDSGLSDFERQQIQAASASLRTDLASAQSAYLDWERQFDAQEGPAIAQAASDEILQGFSEKLSDDAILEAALMAEADWGPQSAPAASFAPSGSSSPSAHSGGNGFLYGWILGSMMGGPSHSGAHAYAASRQASARALSSPLIAARSALRERQAERRFYAQRAALSAPSPAALAAAPAAAAQTPRALNLSALRRAKEAPSPPRVQALSKRNVKAYPDFSADPASAPRAPAYKQTGALAKNSAGLGNLQSKLRSMRSGSLAASKRQIARRTDSASQRSSSSWSRGSATERPGRLVGRSPSGRGSSYSPPSRKSPSLSRSRSSSRRR